MEEDLKEYRVTGTEAQWYRGWEIDEVQRAKYSEISRNSYQAKLKATNENKVGFYQPLNKPKLDPSELMPRLKPNSIKTLSLFSGGGGLDLGFDLAGFDHVASYEILEFAAKSIRMNRPEWKVYSGSDGDVTTVDWRSYKGKVDVIHGGPPCQPFSMAGRQRGKEDARDMIPEFVRSVKAIEPRAFAIENVAGLTSSKFRQYLQETIFEPLEDYTIKVLSLNAASFGIPQVRKRVVFVGFRDKKIAEEYCPPKSLFNFTHLKEQNFKNQIEIDQGFKSSMGVREALGLESIGYDTLAPTIRCTLTGPRSTTSILSSTSAQKVWSSLDLWPNGVQDSREKASAFKTKDGSHRLSVFDCAILQGFPESWRFYGAVYQVLGQIGNSVSPPMAYNLAKSLSQVLSK